MKIARMNIVIVTLVACILSFSGRASAYSLSLADRGDPKEWSVYLNLGTGEDFFSANFDVGFDASNMMYTGVEWNNSVVDVFATYPINPIGPVPPITLSIVTAGDPIATDGDHLLATIKFDVLGTPTTLPSFLNEPKMFSDTAGPLALTGNYGSSVSFSPSTTVVPEPTTLLLLGAGTICLLAYRRKSH